MALIITAGFLFCLAAGSLTFVSSPEYQRISPSEAKQWVGTEKSTVLLDVRTPAEHDERHIPGSILIPVDNVEAEALRVIPDKETVIIVYCRSGRRSEVAARTLVRLGYKKVFDLGGINDWPYEVQQKNNKKVIKADN